MAVRVTSAGLQVIATGGPVRVTSAGLQVIFGPPLVLRVTSAGLQVIARGGVGALWVIQAITDTSATIAVQPDASYLQIQFQTATDVGFTSIIDDHTEDTSSGIFMRGLGSLTPSTTYYVRIRITDAGQTYGWEPTQEFTTSATPLTFPFVANFLFTAPIYGEPIAGTYTVKWELPTGATEADLYISSNLGGAWVLLAAGVTGKQYDLNTTAFSDGNDFLLRLDFNDTAGTKAIHFGFKIENSVTDPTTWIPFTGTPGAGSAAHTLKWSDTHVWYPLPYDGVAATVGLQWSYNAAIAIPPGVPFTDEVDVTSYVSTGTLAGWNGFATLNWATRYYAVEGRYQGIAAGVSGTAGGADCRGITAGFFMGMVISGTHNSTDGAAGPFSEFQVGVTDTPAPNGNTRQYSGGYPGNVFAWAQGSGAANRGFLPIRLRVTRVSPTHVNIKAGMCGWNGSSYWLVEEDNVAFADPVLTGLCEGNCGWVNEKGFSAIWSHAFSDGTHLGVTKLSSTPLADCGCEPYRVCPPLTNMTPLFGRRDA